MSKHASAAIEHATDRIGTCGPTGSPSPRAAVAGLIPGLKRDLARWSIKYPGLRSALSERPRQIIEDELGITLPPGLEVSVIEETPKHVYVVIPVNPYQNLIKPGALPSNLGIDLPAVAAWVTGRRAPACAGGADSTSETIPVGPEAELIARVWQEPELRRDLVDDPRSTIRAATGLELPDDLEVTVLEEDDHRFHVVLPHAPETDWSDLGGLTEDDLASLSTPMVAGSSPLSIAVC